MHKPPPPFSSNPAPFPSLIPKSRAQGASLHYLTSKAKTNGVKTKSDFLTRVSLTSLEEPDIFLQSSEFVRSGLCAHNNLVL